MNLPESVVAAVRGQIQQLETDFLVHDIDRYAKAAEDAQRTLQEAVERKNRRWEEAEELRRFLRENGVSETSGQPAKG